MVDQQFSATPLKPLQPTSELLGADSSDNNTPLKYNIPTYYVTDTAIADHGNPATEGSVAWAIAQIVAEATEDERKGIVRFGSGIFTFLTKLTVQANVAIVGTGASTTILDFQDNAGGIEFNSGDSHQSTTVYSVGDLVQPSTASWPYNISYRCTQAGTSDTSASFTTSALSNLVVDDTFTDGTVSWIAVEEPLNAFGDFRYSMASTMTGTGINVARMRGANILDLEARGGNTTAGNNQFALQFDSTNRFKVNKLDFEVDCNGILINIEDPVVQDFNFGDAVIVCSDIKLNTAATVGYKFLGSDSTFDTINNILLDRCEIVGTGDVEDCQVGIWYEHAKRNTVNHLDIEQINLGIMEIGIVGAGTCDSNSINEYHFLPNSGLQTTEGYPYGRGVPFQAALPGSTNQVDVRENWLLFEPFNLWPLGDATQYIAQDDGIFGRDVTNVPAPVGGIVTLTMSANISNTSAQDLARFPVIAPNSELPSNTSIKAGQSVFDGNTMLPGASLTFAQPASGNYRNANVCSDDWGTISFREVRTDLKGLLFNFKQTGQSDNVITVEAEDSADGVQVNNLVAGDIVSSAPSNPKQGMIITSDATGGGLDGSSGAGTYVYSAGGLWVFLG